LAWEIRAVPWPFDKFPLVSDRMVQSDSANLCIVAENIY
jgi:hypothetical protein